MLPYQTLKNENNKEVLLFPLEYMYVSQEEHNVLSIDFLGYGASGRILDCPCYAPCSGTIVYTGNDHNMIFWSDEEVYLADGTTNFISILVAHSNTPPILNNHINQGELWYHTGNYGQSTGDHLHMEIAKGHVLWNQDGTGLLNPSHLYDTMYVNDTIIINGIYQWKNYYSPTPIIKKRDKFPWVLYTNRIRSRK